MPGERGEKKGIKKNGPGGVPVHPSLAKKCVRGKADGGSQTTQDSHPVHLYEMEVVPSYHEVATSEGNNKGKEFSKRQTFFPETDGEKGHHDRCEILEKDGGSYLNLADCVKISDLDKGHGNPA